jgi:hypothetical protein
MMRKKWTRVEAVREIVQNMCDACVMSLSPRYVSKLSCGHDAQKMDARRSCPRDCAEHARRLRDVALAAGLTRCQCLRLHTGSPLHLAAAGSHLETAKVLVDAKANVNLKDGYCA